jgi:glycerol-3-phosphate cytidylyltransferase
MHIRFLSEEYINKNFTGKQYCMDNGIELYYHKREHKYSSSEIRNRTYELELAKRNEQSNNNPN